MQSDWSKPAGQTTLQDNFKQMVDEGAKAMMENARDALLRSGMNGKAIS